MALIFFCYGKRPFAERDEELGALRKGWRKSRELDGKSGPHVDDRSRESGCPEGLERVEESQVVNIFGVSQPQRDCPLFSSKWMFFVCLFVLFFIFLTSLLEYNCFTMVC